MAVIKTDRLGVYRWTSDFDAFTRDQMDESHQNLEALAAKYTQGTEFPNPSVSQVRSFFYKTDTKVLYYYDGTDENGQWVVVNNLANTVQPLTFGGAGTAGTSSLAARADHVHPLPDPQLNRFVERSTVVQKGDLLAGTAAGQVTRLGAGSNGRVLRTNSATTTGLEWDTLGLNTLNDVNAPNPTDGKALKYRQSTGRWEMVDARSAEFGDAFQTVIVFG